MYKLLILMLKYIPMLISLVYVLNTALSYFYIDIPILSNLAGRSILPWIFMYLSATVFRFCLYHKMFLHYILVTDIINIEVILPFLFVHIASILLIQVKAIYLPCCRYAKLYLPLHCFKNKKGRRVWKKNLA